MASMRDYATELEIINKIILKHQHAIIKVRGNSLWVFKMIIDDSPRMILETWVRGKEINIKVTDPVRICYRIIALTIPSEFESDTLTVEESMDGIITFSAYKVITPGISAWLLDSDTWSRIPIYRVEVALRNSIGVMLRDGRIYPPRIDVRDTFLITHY